MTDKKRAIKVYPDAAWVCERGLYQILRTPSENSPSPLAHESLSSQHLTDDLAWHFAAARIRIAEGAKARMEKHRVLVLRSYQWFLGGLATKAWLGRTRRNRQVELSRNPQVRRMNPLPEAPMKYSEAHSASRPHPSQPVKTSIALSRISVGRFPNTRF
jgi:hypothetical protein